jgi:hypothetical protein
MNYVSEILAALAALEVSGSGSVSTPAESFEFDVFGQKIQVSIPSATVTFKKVA